MRRALGVGVALLLALPGAAVAQDEERQYGPVVMTAGTAELRADPDADQLCVTLLYANHVSGGCHRTVPARGTLAGVPGATGGAVPADVARAEVEWRDGERTSVDSVEGPQGVRYVLAARGRVMPWIVRQFGSDGRLLRAAEVEEGPVTSGPFTLLRGSGKQLGRWTVTASVRRSLAHAPGMPDRTESRACLTLRRSVGATYSMCPEGEPQLRPAFRGDVLDILPRGYRRSDPAPRRNVLVGFLGPGVATIEAVMGDGSVVRPPVRPLAADGGTVPAVAWMVPRRRALRRVVLRDGQGRAVATLNHALAPSNLRSSTHTDDYLEPVLPGAPERAAGPARDGEGILRVRDVGARLCAELEGAESPSCGLLPLDADESLVLGGASGHFGVVGGIVPPQVATVVLSEQPLFTPDPETVRIATHVPSPYAGAFAPHVRVFVGALEHGGLVDVHMLDAQGRELEQIQGVDAFGTWPASPPRTLLRAGRLRLRGYGGDSECFFPPGLPQQCPSTGLAVVSVCSPAVSVVAMSTRGRKGLYVITARGRRLAPLRRRLGKGRTAIFVVPAPDAPRIAGWRGARVRLGPIPSPRAQCGYAIHRDTMKPT